MAQDKGYPPLSRTVEVQIDVVDRANNPPIWDHTIYGPIYVKENMPVGGKVVSVKARSVETSMMTKKNDKHDGMFKKISIKRIRIKNSFNFDLFLRFLIKIYDFKKKWRTITSMNKEKV